MSYIGLTPQQQLLNTSTQFFNGDGSTLEFILARSVASASDLDVLIDNVAQRPFVDYIANNTSLQFTGAPAAGTGNITVTYRAGALNSLNLTANAFGAGTVGEPSVYSVAANNTGFYWANAGTIVATVNGTDRVLFSGNINSTSNTTGALQVLGGVGIAGNLNASGLVNISNNTDSVSITSGALTLDGGAGIVGNLNVGGDITCVGDFTVNGTFTTTGTDALVVNDPFVFLANANPGDSFDTGVIAQYFDTADRYTGYYRDVTDKKYKLFDNLTVRPTTVVNDQDASFRYADLILNTLSATGNVEATFFVGDGSQLTGISADATRIFNGNSEVSVPSVNGSIVSNVNGVTAATLSSTGLAVTGLITATGNINATGNVFGGNVAASGVVTATGNIISAGNISGGNIITGGQVIATSNITAGNFTTAGVANVGGNVVGGNVRTNGLVSAAGDVFGNNFTATTAVNASGNITGANFLTNGLISAAGQVTAGTTINATGNISGGNITTAGLITATGNITGGNLRTQSIVIASSTIAGVTTLSATGTVTAGNISTGGTVSATGNVTGDNINTGGLVSATGSVVGGNISTAGSVSATANITGANIIVSGDGARITRASELIIDTSAGNGNIALQPNGSGNVTTTANVSAAGGVLAASFTTNGAVSATGTVTGGNITTGGQVSAIGAIIASGNITGGNISSGGIITASGNIAAGGAVTGGSFSTAGTVSATGNITSAANISGGNVIATTQVRGTTVSATGNVIGANVQTGTLSLSGNVLTAINSTTDIFTTANVTGGNVIASGVLTAAANVIGGNLVTGGAVSATGTVTGGNISTAGSFTGNGRPLISLNAGNLDTGTVPAARLSGTYTITVSGAATTAGTVTTAAQPNITSVGTLTALSVTGNITGGNLITAGLASVSSITKTGTNAVGNIGQTNNQFNTIFARATSASYADLAEVYAADGEYDPGTVVVFGGDCEVTASQTVGDYRVAGVISTNPAHVMNSNMETPFPAVVGLTGRVPTKVVGPVIKGDLMVSGANGRAQACTAPAVGTVLGKALENFTGATGVIEIAVGRM
jgi:hypothetical protein